MAQTQPTRDEVYTTILAQQGNGKAAMRQAVTDLLASYTMSDEQKARVIDDLPSYYEYMTEAES